MSHKDDELDRLLKPLRGLSPDDLQMRKWQSAVLREIRIDQTMVTTTRRKWTVQLAAAMFVGFIMGAILVQRFSPISVQNSMVAQTSVNNATFEHSHANLD